MTNGICMRTDGSPWVEPFDLKKDSFIDPKDLQEWAIKKSEEHELPITGLPKDKYCTLFRWDMVKRQFIYENTREELYRSMPLEDEERMALINKVASAAEAAKFELVDIYNAEFYSVFPLNNIKPKLTDEGNWTSLNEQIEILGKNYKAIIEEYIRYLKENHEQKVAHSFYDQIATSILLSGIEIIQSFTNDETTLAGLGIVFEKEVGEPALFLSEWQTVEPFEELIPYSTWIMHVDGKETNDMTKNEVRDAMRGPLDSTVQLTVMYDDGSYKDLSLQRKFNIIFEY